MKRGLVSPLFPADTTAAIATVMSAKVAPEIVTGGPEEAGELKRDKGFQYVEEKKKPPLWLKKSRRWGSAPGR